MSSDGAQLEKEHNPERWLDKTGRKIEESIIEYNNIAFELNVDVIMAFKMTPEEYAQATKEAMNGVIEDKRRDSDGETATETSDQE